MMRIALSIATLAAAAAAQEQRGEMKRLTNWTSVANQEACPIDGSRADIMDCTANFVLTMKTEDTTNGTVFSNFALFSEDSTFTEDGRKECVDDFTLVNGTISADGSTAAGSFELDPEAGGADLFVPVQIQSGGGGITFTVTIEGAPCVAEYAPTCGIVLDQDQTAACATPAAINGDTKKKGKAGAVVGILFGVGAGVGLIFFGVRRYRDGYQSLA